MHTLLSTSGAPDLTQAVDSGHCHDHGAGKLNPRTSSLQIMACSSLAAPSSLHGIVCNCSGLLKGAPESLDRLGTEACTLEQGGGLRVPNPSPPVVTERSHLPHGIQFHQPILRMRVPSKLRLGAPAPCDGRHCLSICIWVRSLCHTPQAWGFGTLLSTPESHIGFTTQSSLQKMARSEMGLSRLPPCRPATWSCALEACALGPGLPGAQRAPGRPRTTTCSASLAPLLHGTTH